MREIKIMLSLLALLSLSCSTASQKAPPAIPADFEVKASSYAIPTGLKQTVSINSTGQAQLETEDRGQTTSTLLPQVKASMLRRIVATAKKVDFFALHPSYSGAMTDGQLHSLEIRMDGQTHKVEVEALRQMIKDNSEVKRFAKVWLTIVEATPGDKVAASNPSEGMTGY